MQNQDFDTIKGVTTLVEWLSNADENEENEKLAQKCIQRAQQFGDVGLEFEARYAYIRIVSFLNKHNLAIAMFPWLLKKCDENRERYDYYNTLWAYKWVICNLVNFANIPLEKIDHLMKDCEIRFKDYGSGNKIIHYIKLKYYNAIGDIQSADLEYKLYAKATTKRILDDCKACQSTNLIDHFIMREKYKQALKIAQPIVRGEETCHVVPETTYPRLILPALHIGEIEQAENFAILSKKRLNINQANLKEASFMIIFYSIKDDFIKGRNVMEKQLPFTLKNVTEVEALYLHLSCLIFVKKLLKQGKKSFKIKISIEGIPTNETNTYPTLQLEQFFNEKVNVIANALDIRNKNDYYKSFTLNKIIEIEKLDAKLKLNEKQ